MRAFVLICSLLALVYANCECDDVERELAKEKQEDAKHHGCRNCKAIELSQIDVSSCPDSGFECNANWEMTTNVLFADTCQCLEARCAGTARLAFEKRIVNKMRCNNSQWTVGEKAAKPVICAKSCNTDACAASHPRTSADFRPLKVKPSDAEHQCARGYCDPDYGMSVLNADGSLLMPLPGVSEVTCTGEGIWSSAGAFVMCNAQAANKCPEMPRYPLQDCNIAVQRTGDVCYEALITSSSISCPLAQSFLVIDHPLMGAAGLLGPLTCKGTDWTLPDGRTLAEYVQITVAPIACYHEL